MSCERPSIRNGFSLIELLVVVVIIAILMSLIGPVRKNLMAKAEITQCASNLRSIGSALMLYSTDNEGYFPDRYTWSVQSPGLSHWANNRGPVVLRGGKLWPYIRDESTYLCDGFVRTYQFNPAAAHLTPVRSYGMNEYFTYEEGTGGTSSRAWKGQMNMIRSRIEKPASLGVISEENTWLTPYSRWIINNSCLGVGSYTGNDHVDAIGSYHNPKDGDIREGFGNVVFADGHVELVANSQSKEVFTPERIKQGRGR